MPNIDLEIVANTSYAILLTSYIMRDILWLRVLTVISLCFEIPYYYFQTNPLWDGIGWDAYWIIRLGFERRPVHFTDEEKRLWETALHRLHPRHARKLFKHATIKSIEPNETITKPGDSLNELSLISEGKLGLQVDGMKIEELRPGNFIGQAVFLEGDLDFPTVATIVALEPTRLMTWNKHELRKLIRADNQLSTAVEATLGLEIADFLFRAWQREASGKKEATQS